MKTFVQSIFKFSHVYTKIRFDSDQNDSDSEFDDSATANDSSDSDDSNDSDEIVTADDSDSDTEIDFVVEE